MAALPRLTVIVENGHHPPWPFGVWRTLGGPWLFLDGESGLFWKLDGEASLKGTVSPFELENRAQDFLQPRGFHRVFFVPER